jgi:hypothetical protein
MGRPVILGRRIRIYVTPEHAKAIEREADLLGITFSAVARLAFEAYFALPAKKRRRAS